MDDHFPRTDEENNNNYEDGASSIHNNSSDSFLSAIVQPLFRNSKSHPQLSRFLTQPFVFSGKTMPSLIDQSIMGYIQFAQIQKHEQVLRFFPLEKLDEYYLPQEIEEEVILSPDSSSGSVKRKVISSSPSSYSPGLLQKKTGKLSEVNNANIFGRDSSDVKLQKQQQQQEQQEQQQPIDSPHSPRDNNLFQRKSSPSENGLSKERDVDYPQDKDKTTQLTTEREKSLSQNVATTVNSKTTRPFPKDEDYYHHPPKSTSIKTSSKVYSDMTAPSEGLQSFQSKNSGSAKPPSSIGPSEYNNSGTTLNEPKSFSRSNRSRTSDAIAPDQNNTSSESKQVANIAKGISEQSTDSKYSIVNHKLHATSNKITTTTTGLPNAKIATKTSSEDNPALAPGIIRRHDYLSNNNSADKGTQIERTQQTKKIVTSANGSLNPSDTPQEPTHDSSFELMSSKNTGMNTSIGSIKPSRTKVDKDWDDIRRYGLSKPNISNGSQRPTITINKLELHVIGNKKVQRAIVDRSIESVESLHLHHHNSHNLDIEDNQVNIETLNKSYLWKYKVRLP